MATAIDVLASEPELAPYRAISRAAVISVVLAGISFPLIAFALYSAAFQYGDAVPLGFVGSLFALPAIVLGISGLSTIRRYPSEYTGRRLALTGILGGGLFLVAGAGTAIYTYATEVPEGYARIGFWELQPDPDHPELPVSPRALELAGKPVFIKGYMHPGIASMGKVDRFILVPDMGTCCFGGQPKPTDMIEVHVPEGGERLAYSRRRLKLAGKFALTNEPTQSLGLQGVWYHLVLDQAR
jgi:hypothetical protein